MISLEFVKSCARRMILCSISILWLFHNSQVILFQDYEHECAHHRWCWSVYTHRHWIDCNKFSGCSRRKGPERLFHNTHPHSTAWWSSPVYSSQSAGSTTMLLVFWQENSTCSTVYHTLHWYSQRVNACKLPLDEWLCLIYSSSTRYHSGLSSLYKLVQTFPMASILNKSFVWVRQVI